MERKTYRTMLWMITVLAFSVLLDSSASAVDSYGSVTTQFNSGSLVQGDYLWFSSVIRPQSFSGASPMIVDFTGGMITIGSAELTVPNAQVIFDSSITTASTSFNAVLNRWETIAPWATTNNVFLAGFAYRIPENLSGGISVTWSGNFDSNIHKEQIEWQWAAAQYKEFSFNSDYNTYQVKPTNSTTLDSYPYPHQAGTPEYYAVTGFLVNGGTGDAGNNFTGYYTQSQSVTTTPEPSTIMTALGILSTGIWAFRRKSMV